MVDTARDKIYGEHKSELWPFLHKFNTPLLEVRTYQASVKEFR